MFDIIAWTIIGGAIVLVFLFFAWALCVIAGETDDAMEEFWRKEDESESEGLSEEI